MMKIVKQKKFYDLVKKPAHYICIYVGFTMTENISVHNKGQIRKKINENSHYIKMRGLWLLSFLFLSIAL